jgi:putative hydrolase of the HAD superfamily
MVEVYRGHVPEIAPYPGARKMLARLRARFKLGLLTDGPGDVQRQKMRALGLDEMFDAAVVTDDLAPPAWKPSSRPFFVVADQLGIATGEATYVADNPAKDFLGARRVGMRTIRIRHADGLHAAFEPPSPEHAPAAVVPGFDELERYIASWPEGTA